MALEGTLRDFSLPDIFQLIGIQRKTGILTLKNEDEMVTVSFVEGSVVSADSLRKRLEDQLGSVLVKAGHITDSQLESALKTQRETLKRLGHVLIDHRYISSQDLRHALQLQVTQVIYRLFRWKDGEYHFSQEEKVDYDRENFTPISAENILMEGVRMVDEWPMIEKKIHSAEMVFRKASCGSGGKVLGADPDEHRPQPARTPRIRHQGLLPGVRVLPKQPRCTPRARPHSPRGHDRSLGERVPLPADGRGVRPGRL